MLRFGGVKMAKVEYCDAKKKTKTKKNIWNDGDNPIVISKLIKRKIKYLIRYLDI